MTTIPQKGQSDWEGTFRTWALPPGATEEDRCKNAMSMVQNAMRASTKLKGRSVKVFVQGSYRNNTNARRESDVDVGVLCEDVCFPILPDGMNDKDFGLSDHAYTYVQFKADVGEALHSYFGPGAVARGNKAFDIRENTYRVEADVAPFFEHRRYSSDGSYLSGVELRPDNGVPAKVINWPEQHCANGVRKNDDTARRFKTMVRVGKNLCHAMQDKNIQAAQPITGFLIECLVWNAPNSLFGSASYYQDLRGIIAFLYNATKSDADCVEWGEVSELKYLLRGSQKWTRQQANDFLLAAWQYVGFR